MTSEAFTDVAEYLARHTHRIEVALHAAVDRLPHTLAPDLVPAMRHGVLGGGKRLRPVLCVAAYEACSGEVPHAAYDLAASLEMIHAYSLMHDDLPCMDDAELRRGRATTHRAHGEDSTMRAGIALIPAAALQALRSCEALDCEPALCRSVALEVMRAAGAGGMVGGQWLDLLGEARPLGPEDLDGLHRRKTGALLASSLVVGGMAAGAAPETCAALLSYGRAVGLGFQIADDVLDATESADTLGKNPSDADRDKSTYVALYGVEEARRRADLQVASALAVLQRVDLHAPALEALAVYLVRRTR